jgi:hypothetical protein
MTRKIAIKGYRIDKAGKLVDHWAPTAITRP